MTGSLVKMMKNFIRTKISRDRIKLFVEDLDGYKSLRDKFRDGSRKHYSCHVVLCGLCENTSTKKIVEELDKLNLAAEVFPMTSKRTTLCGQNRESNDLQGRKFASHVPIEAKRRQRIFFPNAV